ncbi:sulfurtransferase complex subunit TusC [Shewanella ulleungensis]|jgi:tRNA 2-thiouridine synthesizing protein C|uniref:Sulfurtransferase TusC n=1 Tax=Shewanella ulleungensis TaxID=2282699 RepID=A0ABQ2QKE7_9GAMM|nr:sulfurtransferase complex subunit TusC [Shewanella ulleungensis]MCL1151796.1 sulfurtransferase complex subunit TusC [Shewanella ulleungensis]GGP84536.1 sulfurtransferase TusC [Shewanella ulleungensis]
MKSVAILFRHAPFGTTCGREGLDVAMLSASFEQQVSLIFTDEAVLHLLAGQTPEQAGSKDYLSALKALPLYDIDTVLVCNESMQRLGINAAELSIDAKVASCNEITNTLQAVDEVLVF